MRIDELIFNHDLYFRLKFKLKIIYFSNIQFKLKSYLTKIEIYGTKIVLNSRSADYESIALVVVCTTFTMQNLIIQLLKFYNDTTASS